eukprot:1162069-Pelagomonas_calceolata.AAC.5
MAGKLLTAILMAFMFTVASSSVWPPLRNMMPGMAAGTTLQNISAGLTLQGGASRGSTRLTTYLRKTGNQASALLGHNLIIRTCSAYFLSMPCQVWGPRYAGSGSWRAVTAGRLTKTSGSGQLA